MKIPVFVSCPTSLSLEQEQSRKVILAELKASDLEPRALGRSDYPTFLPLHEVLILAKHCAGGVILGFEQFQAEAGTWKRWELNPKQIEKGKPVPFPTPWNHLEAGILFSLGLPLLVFREEGISGGVFDNGVTDVFVHQMPKPKMPKDKIASLKAVFLKWQANVREHYYR